MDIAGIIALVACTASICAKMFFLLHGRRQARILERENQARDKIKTDLYLAKIRRNRLETEGKKLVTRSKRTQQSIIDLGMTLQELQARKKEEDEVRELQREIIKGKRNQ